MTGKTLTYSYEDGAGHLGQASMSESQTKQACNALNERIGAYMGIIEGALDGAGSEGVVCIQVEAKADPEAPSWSKPLGWATRVKVSTVMHVKRGCNSGKFQ